MKKSLFALATLGAFASAAHAQSSVTLYGLIDAGLDYTNNAGGHSLWNMQSGVTQGSRWGLKGTEDLGNGLKAVFQLENGFNLFTGKLSQNQNGSGEASSSMFGRQAWVGLSSNSWGTVTIGRQYDTIDDYIQQTTSNGLWSGFFSHAGDIDNTDNAYRVNNSIKYASPSYNGLTFGGMYSFGGDAGEYGKNSMFGLGAAYKNGPAYVGAAYEYARNPAQQYAEGNWASSSVTTANAYENGAFGYVGSAPSSSQIIGVGGTYAFGRAKVGANYTNTRFGDALNTGDSVTFNNAEVWGQYALTPAFTLIAGDTYTWSKADYTIASGQKPTWNQVNFMADYAFSKRTDVYLMSEFETSGGGATAAIYNGGDFAAPASTTDEQLAVRLGIRTKF